MVTLVGASRNREDLKRFKHSCSHGLTILMISVITSQFWAERLQTKCAAVVTLEDYSSLGLALPSAYW